jgi:hypothetical protein
MYCHSSKQHRQRSKKSNKHRRARDRAICGPRAVGLGGTFTRLTGNDFSITRNPHFLSTYFIATVEAYTDSSFAKLAGLAGLAIDREFRTGAITPTAPALRTDTTSTATTAHNAVSIAVTVIHERSSRCRSQ